MIECQDPNVVFTLDKDLKQQGIPDNEKVYSLNTCTWMTKEENAALEMVNSNVKNPYHCVHEDRGKFRVRVRHRYSREPLDLGFYDNLIAAVNVANYGNYHFGDLNYINHNIEFMDLKECVNHRLGSKRGDINLLNNDQIYIC